MPILSGSTFAAINLKVLEHRPSEEPSSFLQQVLITQYRVFATAKQRLLHLMQAQITSAERFRPSRRSSVPKVEVVDQGRNSSSSNTTRVGSNERKSLKSNDEDSKTKALTTIGLGDSALAEARRGYLKAWLIGLFLTTLSMWSCLSIYWGAYYRQPQQLQRLSVALIDLDSPASVALGRTPVLGPVLIAAAYDSTLTGGKYHMSWLPIDNTQFDISNGTGAPSRGVNVHEWAANAVHNEDYFGVILANANATTAPLSAFSSAVAGQTVTFEGTGALTFYYAEARTYSTEGQWVATGITAFLQRLIPIASASFAQQIASEMNRITTAQLTALNAEQLGSIIASPFGYSEWDIRPLDAFAGIAATTVGLIYLVIFVYLVTLFFNGARSELESKLELKSLLLFRFGVLAAQYFFLSLCLSLLSIAFHVPFSRFYGHVGFFLFWMSNWLVMWAAGMPIELSLAWLGPKGTAYFLTFWVIINISPALLDIADEAHFYSIGFALPIFQAVQVAKTIAFGTKNRLLQAFVVEVAWVVLGTAVLAGSMTVQHRKANKK